MIQAADTTFPIDFSIAETTGGEKAIKDTYDRAIKEWKDDVRFFAPLVMTLNHKIWQWYEVDDERAELYNELWAKADALAYEMYEEGKWTDEEIQFYVDYLD